MNPLDARRRLLGRNVYKRTTEGNPAIAQGSLARRYLGITMQGWTEQPQYEGKNLFNGIFMVDTVLDTNGETVPYSGRSTTDFIKVKSSTDYTGFARYLRACYYDVGKVIIHYDDDDTVTRQTPEGCEYVRFCFVNGSNVMFNEGATALPYEPYTGGQPSPNPDYPQAITSAGKYDEGTGKYQYTIKISDSEESPTKSQTVLLTADRPLTKWDKLEKRGGQWGWVYKSEEIESYADGGVPGEYFSTTGQLSVGAQVWYETTTETFVPLSESEQEQMNALYTFRPTTVLSNDCGCNMTLTYKTKKSLEVAT